jgi:hypothetical protein
VLFPFCLGKFHLKLSIAKETLMVLLVALRFITIAGEGSETPARCLSGVGKGEFDVG